MLPEKMTGDTRKANAGSLLQATQQECSRELLALLFVSCRQRGEYWRGDMPGLYLLYKPDDAGTLFLAEGHGAGQAVELP